MTDVLFRSESLLARWRGGFGLERCVVTFSSYTYDYRTDRPGFGESYFTDRKIDAIHVTTRDNRWYDEPELVALLASIAQKTGLYSATATYGSSMGGFAALHFAGHVGAGTAIGISPQFAGDRINAPFETRWRRERRSVRFPPVPSRPAEKQYLFYDPRHEIDTRHAECFRKAAPVVAVAVPYGGHPVGAVLEQLKLLQGLIPEILADTFDPCEFKRAYRARRAQSSQYLWTIATTLPDSRLALKKRLCQLAVERQRSSHSLRHLAEVLRKLDQPDEAASLLREAIAADPDDIRANLALVEILGMRGKRNDGARILAELRRRFPGNSLITGAWVRHFLGRFCLFRGNGPK